MSATQLSSPSFLEAAGEVLTPLELARLTLALPSLLKQDRGQGQPVIVLPGWGAGDFSTGLMRQYLVWLGYRAQGWALGRNSGDVGELLPMVCRQVIRAHVEHNHKVALIGWSLGGVFARETAREHPDIVSQVITMGTPIIGGPKYTSFARLYVNNGADLDAIEAKIAEREQRPIKVPVTSIYSKRDGVVAWQASVDAYNSHVDHIEVSATHFGLGVSPDVFKTIARKLAAA